MRPYEAERSILAVVAHPDDVELTCGGTIAKWVGEGAEAVLVVATDGARGGKDPGSHFESVASRRRREQDTAAQVLGFQDTVYLGFRDGELQDDENLRGALVEQIRRIRPNIAILMDPTTVIYRNEYVNHRDHRMLGMAMLDALYPEASNAGYFPEQITAGLKPHKVPEMLLSGSEHPNYWVDVTNTIEKRFEALRCHESQIRLWPDNGEEIIRQQRAMAAALGAEHGADYVEEFRRIVVNPLS